MEDFYREKAEARTLLTKEKKGLFQARTSSVCGKGITQVSSCRLPLLSLGDGREIKERSMTDCLTGADQKIAELADEDYNPRCKLVQPLWKTVKRCLKKLKIELPHDPAIPLLGIYPEKMKTNSKRYMHPNVHCSTIYNSQVMKAT